ncbi:hypothetical protein HanIR_Chr04g0166371 [Helianthus annuus]|nr:hypothetical protein HanIR_Chr04g0166371 [Helianthus annuus]
MVNALYNAWISPFDVYGVPAPQRARVLVLVVFIGHIYWSRKYCILYFVATCSL